MIAAYLEISDLLLPCVFLLARNVFKGQGGVVTLFMSFNNLPENFKK